MTQSNRQETGKRTAVVLVVVGLVTAALLAVRGKSKAA
jgi:preprotein translocase subunit SecE